MRTLRQQATLNLTDERMAMTIGLVLGGAALLLAAVGLYGAMSYAVGQRTRELGVRIALGATTGDIRRLVLRQGIVLSVAGTVLGAALALWLGRALESRLFGVRPNSHGSGPSTANCSSSALRTQASATLRGLRIRR